YHHSRYLTILLINCITILTRLHGINIILIGLSQQNPSHYQTYCIQSDSCFYPPRRSGMRYA
ncbi:hypothetical protein K503DRAFT_772473, partial [Rhizopogon vinicolor AM-OR11-026]